VQGVAHDGKSRDLWALPWKMLNEPNTYTAHPGEGKETRGMIHCQSSWSDKAIRTTSDG